MTCATAWCSYWHCGMIMSRKFENYNSVVNDDIGQVNNIMLKNTLHIFKQNLEKKKFSGHTCNVLYDGWLQLATACDLALWGKNELIQKSICLCVPHMQA